MHVDQTMIFPFSFSSNYGDTLSIWVWVVLSLSRKVDPEPRRHDLCINFAVKSYTIGCNVLLWRHRTRQHQANPQGVLVGKVVPSSPCIQRTMCMRRLYDTLLPSANILPRREHVIYSSLRFHSQHAATDWNYRINGRKSSCPNPCST